MSEQELHVVTGAFGSSGKHIASRLLAEGRRYASELARRRNRQEAYERP